MGKVEKVIVLSVLFLIALILVVSLNSEDPFKRETAQVLGGKASGGTVAQAPNQPARQAPTGQAPGAETPGALSIPVQPTVGGPGVAATAKLAPPVAVNSNPVNSNAVPAGLPQGAALRTLEGLEDSYLPGLKFYTWQEGDRWRLLAKRYYGDDKAFRHLMKANENRVDVQPGQKVFIPIFENGVALTPDAATDAQDVAANAPRSNAAPVVNTPVVNKPTTLAQPQAGAKSTQAPAASGLRTYTVKDGESLWKIAERELGSGKRWEEIFEANRDVLSAPSKVKKGQKLRIP